MERQRSSSYLLLNPKSLLLLSFASSSLLFSFLFSLFALRFGRPLHLPFASAGGNFSSNVRRPVLGGGSLGNDDAVEVGRAVLGSGSGGLGKGSILEGARYAGGEDFAVQGLDSAMEVKETTYGGGYGKNWAKDTTLERSGFTEAGNFSLRGSESVMEVKEVDLGGGSGKHVAKDSMVEKPSLAEGANATKGAADSAMATHLEGGNASGSQGAASSIEKLVGSRPVEAVHFSMQPSDLPMEAAGATLQDVRIEESSNSSGQRAYASQPVEQWKSLDFLTEKNSFEAAQVRSKQGASSIQEAVLDKVHLARGTSQCDVYDGRWVFDETYPLYRSNSCPFADEGFSCEANGRTDRGYMKWRWQPQQCDIPRFDARRMLEMLRGKRLVFVGDSINRNQWESMMCLLREAVLDPARIHEAHGRKITKERGDYSFKFLDYNCSVEYHVTHFLVHEGKVRISQKHTKTLRIDTIDRSSSKWRGADVLVFNTAHWWSHHKTKAGINYYQEGDHIHHRLDASTAFDRALTTWASWVDRNINSRKTLVFFRSSAPTHFSGGEWNSGGHCKESTLPLNGIRSRPVPKRNRILEQVVRQMNTPVTILNITNLSGLRIDGHPSVYGKKAGDGTASGIQDCSHWCLPGVPDTWNELLFYHLVSARVKDSAG